MAARPRAAALVQVFFVSTATYPPDNPGTAELLEATRCRNREKDITGLLLRTDQHFVQYAEGEDKDLHRLMQAIHCDSRHWDIQEWPHRKATRRLFSGWRSECRSSHQAETLASLARAQRGIMPVDTLLAHLRKLSGPMI